MAEVPATRTPYSHPDILQAMGDAYALQLGHPPKHETLAVICAQLALETGDGHACIAWNPGNYKRGAGPDWCSFETTEDDAQGHATIMVCEFSAWPSLTAACADYVTALYTHWVEAWTAAVDGSPEGFAHGLKLRGYYTAPEAAYAAGLRRWFGPYLAILGGDSVATLPDMSGYGGGVLGVLGVLGP